MLQELFARPYQSVSQLGKRLGVPVPVASVYLRALNARGLLTARRSGKQVFYTVEANETIRGCSELVAALRAMFAHHPHPADAIFRHATAFTHPRRIDIIRALRGSVLPPKELSRITGISSYAMKRHLGKLEQRGFVRRLPDGRYRTAAPPDRFSQTLVRIARGI